MKAVPIKIQVAAIDLIDFRGIPQTACPLVQPFPILVPIPTKNPPIIKSTMLVLYSIVMSLSKT